MSENKDLEMIKECIHQIRWSDAEGEYDEVIEAASRMAAENKQYKEIAERLAASGNNSGMALIELKTEIERLKEENTSYTIGYTEKCAEIEDLNESNARLKAELAKRPEIIRCGECRNRNRLFKCPISEANALIKQLEKVPSKTYFIELTDNDYCSAGVRRESEGK